jgi:hypothetical protein
MRLFARFSANMKCTAPTYGTFGTCRSWADRRGFCIVSEVQKPAKRWTVKRKLEVVMEGFRGEITPGEIARKYGITRGPATIPAKCRVVLYPRTAPSERTPKDCANFQFGALSRATGAFKVPVGIQPTFVQKFDTSMVTTTNVPGVKGKSGRLVC